MMDGEIIVGFEGPGLGFHEFPGILSFCVDKFSYRKSMDLRKDFFKFACIRIYKIDVGFEIHRILSNWLKSMETEIVHTTPRGREKKNNTRVIFF